MIQLGQDAERQHHDWLHPVLSVPSASNIRSHKTLTKQGDNISSTWPIAT